jgi:hypothetical protein
VFHINKCTTDLREATKNYQQQEKERLSARMKSKGLFNSFMDFSLPLLLPVFIRTKMHSVFGNQQAVSWHTWFISGYKFLVHWMTRTKDNRQPTPTSPTTTSTTTTRTTANGTATITTTTTTTIVPSARIVTPTTIEQSQDTKRIKKEWHELSMAKAWKKVLDILPRHPFLKTKYLI